MDVSVIVVSWNVKDLLRDCLKSIYGQTRTSSFEVYVVDNSSSDDSVKMVEQEFPEVSLIRNSENLGFAKANNQALRRSKGRYILLLNPDTVVLGNMLDAMVLFMDSHRDVGAAGPKILNPDKTVQLTCGMRFPGPLAELFQFTKLSDFFPRSRIFGRLLMGYWDHNDTREIEALSGACMMVRREAIEQTGLMDEDFFLFAEDTDWCFRIRQNGWRIYLNADAEIIHLSHQSLKRSAVSTAVEGYRSMYLFYMKHLGLLSAFSYRAMTFAFVGLRYVLYWTAQYVRPTDRPRCEALLRQYRRILHWSIYLQ